MAKARGNPKDQIREALKEDDQFKKFRRIVKVVEEQLKVDKDRSEALSLHASRSSRKLYADKVSPMKVMDATMKDMSFRARMSEMRVNVSHQLAILEEAIKAIRKYMHTEYHDELGMYSNAESKKNLIDRFLKKALELEADGQSLINLLDTLIKDIDQAAFGLRNAVEILKLLDGSKGSRNV